jgi:ABC-2 type transport system permease protein
MAGSVFLGTLRRSWRTMIFWAIGIGLFAALNIIAVPDANGMKATAEAIAQMPPFVVQLVGGGDLTFLASTAGYLNNQYYAIVLVIFGIYAIVVGLNITANEEEKRILDVVLSLPVPRWRVMLERFLAYAALTAGVLIGSTAIIYLTLAAEPSVVIDPMLVAVASLNILPATLVVLAFTMFIATLVRRRGQAITITVVFLIASWFIDVLGRTATTSIMNTARAISFYAYYDSTGVLQNGLSFTNIALLLTATVILVIGALWRFEHRDISV